MKKIIFVLGFTIGFFFAVYWEGTQTFIDQYSPFPDKKWKVNKQTIVSKAKKTRAFIKEEFID